MNSTASKTFVTAMNFVAVTTAMTAITLPLRWLGFIGESAILRHTDVIRHHTGITPTTGPWHSHRWNRARLFRR